MKIYEVLRSAHSGWRYIALLLLVVAIIVAIRGWTGGTNYTKGNRKLYLFTMIAMHIQLLFGLVLYFLSPRVSAALADFGGAMKNTDLRFFALEHAIAMVVAVLLITMGRKKAEKLKADARKHKQIAITYLVAFIIIFISIPWPFFNRLSFDVQWF